MSDDRRTETTSQVCEWLAPRHPERDGWYWIDGGNGPQVVKWASKSRKWKRAGRQTPIPPQLAAKEGWRLLKECLPVSALVPTAAEIERLRTALAIYANPKHWTFRDEGSWDTIFIGPPGPDRDGWEIAAEALK